MTWWKDREAHLAHLRAISSAGGKSHSRDHMSALGRKRAAGADMAQVGSLGWAALVQAKGLEGAHQALAQWHVDHPSQFELAVAETLDRLGIQYEREHRLVIDDIPMRFDFWLPDYQVAIEVQGQIHHPDHEWNDEERQARFQHRMQVLRQSFRVLEIGYDQVDQAESMIIEFLEDEHADNG